jgi:KDO2-lipid IV(A) lauroyltransferase
MARSRSLARNLAEYVPARMLASAVRCLSPERNQGSADLVAKCYAACCRRRTARARDNIMRSFPDWSHAEAQATAVASVQHLFRLAVVDAVQMDRYIHPARWWDHVDIRAVGPVIEAVQSGRSALLVTGHLGNWELLGYTLSMLGVPLHALARPLDNPLLNAWLLGIRQAWGMRILTKFGAAPEMQAILDRGEHLGFIADQNAGDRGMFVPFFGRLASAYKSIAVLAITNRSPVVVAAAFRTAPGLHYRVSVHEVIQPEQWQDKADPVYWLTARYTWGLEQLVRSNPNQYLWLHRRWKSRPRHETQGKPMPRALVRQIEQLDWLDAPARGAIIDTSNGLAQDAAHSLEQSCLNV